MNSLPWSTISERWPDACVMWDRDVAPTLTWDPVFVERDGALWAEDPADHAWVRGRAMVLRCKCLTWDGAAWLTHAAHDKRKRIAALGSDLREGRMFIRGTPWPSDRGARWQDDRVDATRHARGWRRQYLGEWVDTGDDDLLRRHRR